MPYNSGFSLWMTTRIANPQFPPEIEADVTLVNFVIMQDGLTEQLLVMRDKQFSLRKNLAAFRYAYLKRALKILAQCGFPVCYQNAKLTKAAKFSGNCRDERRTELGSSQTRFGLKACRGAKETTRY